MSSTVQLGITVENEKQASVKVTVSGIMFKRKLEWQRGLISYKVSKTSTSLLTLLISNTIFSYQEKCQDNRHFLPFYKNNFPLMQSDLKVRCSLSSTPRFSCSNGVQLQYKEQTLFLQDTRTKELAHSEIRYFTEKELEEPHLGHVFHRVTFNV